MHDEQERTVTDSQGEGKERAAIGLARRQVGRPCGHLRLRTEHQLHLGGVHPADPGDRAREEVVELRQPQRLFDRRQRACFEDPGRCHRVRPRFSGRHSSTVTPYPRTGCNCNGHTPMVTMWCHRHRYNQPLSRQMSVVSMPFVGPRRGARPTQQHVSPQLDVGDVRPRPDWTNESNGQLLLGIGGTDSIVIRRWYREAGSRRLLGSRNRAERCGRVATGLESLRVVHPS